MRKSRFTQLTGIIIAYTQLMVRHMDTNQYSNILKAIGNNGNTLSTQQQADNYSAFSKMMSDGIYIPDLIKKIDSLEAKVKSLEENGQKPTPMDLDLFAVMESAVKDDPDVKNARKRMADEKSRVISEMCMKDEAYRRSADEFRRAVNTAYVRTKEEQAKD